LPTVSFIFAEGANKGKFNKVTGLILGLDTSEYSSLAKFINEREIMGWYHHLFLIDVNVDKKFH